MIREIFNTGLILRPRVRKRLNFVDILFAAVVFSLVQSTNGLFSGSLKAPTERTNEFPLYGKSFIMRSAIVTVTGKESLARMIHLTERYSADQRRARLHFNTTSIGQYNNSEFYYDHDLALGVVLNTKEKTCKSMNLVEMYANLSLDLSNFSNIFESLGDEPDRREKDVEYVVGPSSRLLFFLSNQMQKVEQVESSHFIKSVRNRPVIEFRLSLRRDELESVSISVYYDKNTPKDVVLSTIPLQVDIEFYDRPGNVKQATTFYYYAYEFLDSNKVQHSADNFFEQLNEDKILDQFAFPVSYGCSELFHINRRESQTDLFERVPLDGLRFSFKVQSGGWTSSVSSIKTGEHFVAFDGPTQLARIDSRWPRETKLKASTLVLDLLVNRKYSIIGNYASKPYSNLGINDKKAFQEDLNNEERAIKCSVTTVMEPYDAKCNLWPNLSAFLVGAQRLTYMGRGKVRGRFAHVYEANSISLPYWYAQPMVYQTVNRSEYRYRQMGEAVGLEMGNIYSAVVYVSAALDEDGFTMEKLPTLLLLELYDSTMSRTSAYRRFLFAAFHEFVWDLAEAPNGDRVPELFALKDLCSRAENRSGRFVEVNLLLEGAGESLKEMKDDNGSYDWLLNANSRNQALMAGLKDLMQVQINMVYDLETRIVFSNLKQTKRTIGSLSMLVAFKVAEHRSSVYNIVFIGNAIQMSISDRLLKQRAHIVVAKSIVDCLWLADESSKPAYIYYYEPMRSCVLDLELSKSASPDPKKSRVFQLQPGNTGELFRIEGRPETRLDYKCSWLRDNQLSHLESHVITLTNYQPHYGAGEQKVDNEDLNYGATRSLSMRVKSVKLKRFNYLQSSSFNEENQPISGYPGLGIAPTSALRELRRIKDEKEGQEISLEQCKGACLEELTCQTYSYCVEAARARCTLSNFSFGVAELEEKNDLKSQRASAHTIIQVMALSGERVDLVRDFRCHLYSKSYLELFVRSVPRTAPKSYRLFGVYNEEQCAKLCTAKSLTSINGAKASEDQSKASEEKKEEEEAKERMKDFCKEFFYKDSVSISESNRVKLEQESIDVVGSGTANGYCAIEASSLGIAGYSLSLFDGPAPSPTSNESANSQPSATKGIFFNLYKFDYTKFFERQHSFGLVQSPLSLAEQEAFANVMESRKGTSDQQAYQVLEEAVRLGKNFQQKLEIEPLECAKSCLFQTASLWPACRSFDVLIVSHNKWRTSFLCHLNTQTRTSDTLNEGQLSQHTGLHVTQVWHYEPRLGLSPPNSRPVILTAPREVATRLVSLSELIVLITVSLASIIGLNLGIHIGHQYVFRRKPVNIEVVACLHEIQQASERHLVF